MGKPSPKVSIFMPVYNHERWVAQAIEGVMMQCTDFSIELVIGEDCSTDGSRDIVKVYKRKYPDSILLLLNEKNIGPSLNGNNILRHCRGEYIAYCEGDDFWTDPYKLERQVRFLDENQDYVACYHAVKVVDGNGKEIEIDYPDFTSRKAADFLIEDIWSLKLPGQSGTLVHRNVLRSLPKHIKHGYDICRTNGDQKLVVVLLAFGKIWRMGECMSTYRRTYTGDSWNARTKRKEMTAYSYISYLEIEKFANKTLPVHGDCHPYARNVLYDFLLNFVQNKKRGKYKSLKDIVCYDIYTFLQFVFIDSQYLLLRYIVEHFFWRVERKYISQRAATCYLLFGTGEIGKKCYGILSACNLQNRVQVFWDNSSEKQKKKLYGKTILAPGEGWRLGTGIIIIATVKYTDEIREQLESMGYSYGRDILSYSDFRKWLLRDVFGDKHPFLYRLFWGS